MRTNDSHLPFLMQANGAEKMTAACVYKVLSPETIVYIEKQRNYKNSVFQRFYS